METQWQRALEMISTGSPDDDVDRHQSAKKSHNQSKAIDSYETPVNSRISKKFEDGQSGDDKLQSFIDLVISQNFSRISKVVKKKRKTLYRS